MARHGLGGDEDNGREKPTNREGDGEAENYNSAPHRPNRTKHGRLEEIIMANMI